MRKKKRIIGLLGVGLLAMSLSGCMLSEFKPVPHEERYHNIDNVLETIDYKTIGEISKETMYQGSAVLGTSYKEIYYKDSGAYDELSKRLEDINPDCIITSSQIHCSFPYVSFYGYNQNERIAEPYMRISDGTGGRGGRTND